MTEQEKRRATWEHAMIQFVESYDAWEPNGCHAPGVEHVALIRARMKLKLRELSVVMRIFNQNNQHRGRI